MEEKLRHENQIDEYQEFEASDTDHEQKDHELSLIPVIQMIKSNDSLKKTQRFVIKKRRYLNAKNSNKSCFRKSKSLKKKVLGYNTLEQTVELSQSPIKPLRIPPKRPSNDFIFNIHPRLIQ